MTITPRRRITKKPNRFNPKIDEFRVILFVFTDFCPMPLFRGDLLDQQGDYGAKNYANALSSISLSPQNQPCEPRQKTQSDCHLIPQRSSLKGNV